MISYTRWIVAAAGAGALVWLVVGTTNTASSRSPSSSSSSSSPTAAPSVVADVADPPSVAGGCPADAPPAALNYTLKDVNDVPVDLAAYKGKVVLLDFWATWCGPCKVEIPGFIELQEQYGKRGLQVIGVSVDDTADKLKPYVSEMQMNYPVLQGLGHDDMLDAYGPMLGIPVAVIISRDGKVCSRHTGLTSKDAFEQQIKALL